MTNSTAKQRQQLGYLRKLLKLDDSTYYEMLASYNAESCKELSSREIMKLINQLRDDAKEIGLFKPKKSFIKYKYNNLSGRDKNMASPAQLRKIEGMWNDRTRATTPEDIEKALKTFIKKISGKDEMRFLTAIDVRKIINALNHMK